MCITSNEPIKNYCDILMNSIQDFYQHILQNLRAMICKHIGYKKKNQPILQDKHMKTDCTSRIPKVHI